jgi:putative transposase
VQPFTGVLRAAGVRISMDGRGRWMDNVFIERLWRSLKHENIYLKVTLMAARPMPGLVRGSPFTTASVRTKRLATARRWRSGANPSAVDSAIGLWT